MLSLVRCGDPPPHPFDLALSPLSLETVFLRHHRGFCFPPLLGGDRCLADKVDETLDRVFAVFLLSPVPAGGDDENTFARQSSAGEADEPNSNVIREGRRVQSIETKLDGRRDLVDVLPAGTGRADELEAELALIDRNGGCDPNHYLLRCQALTVRPKRTPTFPWIIVPGNSKPFNFARVFAS